VPSDNDAQHVLPQDASCTLLHYVNGVLKDVVKGTICQPKNPLMHNMPISAGMFKVAVVRPLKGCDGVDPPMQPHGAKEHYSPEGCVGWPLLWPKSQIWLACVMQKLWPIEVCCRKLSKTDETVQFGLNSDWTSRNRVKPSRMRI
jgi:hypothetical protein